MNVWLDESTVEGEKAGGRSEKRRSVSRSRLKSFKIWGVMAAASQSRSQYFVIESI